MEKKKNLSEVSVRVPKNIEELGVGIVTAEWNSQVTNSLREGALSFLIENGVPKENITEVTAPGCYELPLVSKWLLDSTSKRVDVVIALGCVIQGETPHFDFISNACANGIMQVNLEVGPVVFGVLTTLNMEQALDRAGGKHGNKGTEAAATALSMLATFEDIFK